MEKLYRGPYIDAYCQVWFHLAKLFQRRRLNQRLSRACIVHLVIKKNNFKMAAVFKGNDYLPLKFASVSFYCQVSDTGSVG
jgi:hypothetical protein